MNTTPPSDDLLLGTIAGRARDADGLPVRRVLPWGRRRHVGPFVFFDHMGPMTFAPGTGVDVRPHPHIGLATLTYLFEGEIVHRDTLGSEQPIRPGDVNWMMAGRGIAHSERTRAELRRSGGPMHGIQTWLAPALSTEDDAPTFTHHAAATIPLVDRPGVRLRVIAGEAYGVRSPVAVPGPTLYVEARLDAGATLDVPDGHAERALYVVEGTAHVEVDARATDPVPVGVLALLHADRPARIVAKSPSRVLLLGGAPPEPERQIWWNF